MTATLTQRDISRAVAGAIAGGLQPGSFRLRIDARRGLIDVLPLKTGDADLGDDEGSQLDAEIRAHINGQG